MIRIISFPYLRLMRVHDKNFKPYLEQSRLDERIVEMAATLSKTYIDKNPIFLVILNGAFRFAADLARAIDFPAEWQFIKITSYAGMQSTGKVKISDTLTLDLANRHIIVVEDIVDTGRSMTFFLDRLDKIQPASIFLTSMFVKEDVLQGKVHVNLAGFSIPDKFIVGYGLDYDEHGREINGIWQVENND